jgi:hypothetical protein
MIALAVPSWAVASSLPPGVHVDPGSPAAKEYQIPLGAARGNGQSGSSSSGSLFGAGITKGGGGSGGTKSDTASSHASSSAPAATGTPTPTPTAATVAPVTKVKARTVHHRRRRAHHDAAAAPAPITHHRAAPAVSPQRAIGTEASSGIGITWMLGAAAIVLALGALGGAALSRRGRRRQHPGDGRTSPYPS